MQNDIKIIQGTWKVVSLEIEGSASSPVTFAESKIRIEGDQFTTIGMGADYNGRISLNQKSNPKSIDMNFTSGPEAGNRSLGIYEITGDTLVICLTLSGEVRPIRFATSSKSGLALETLKREPSGSQLDLQLTKSKPIEPQEESAPTDSQPQEVPAKLPFELAPELEGEWTMVSGVMDGHPMEKKMVTTGRRATIGNETTISFAGQVFIRLDFVVDKSVNPHTIDCHNTGGMNAGKRQLGIYQLDGKLLNVSLAAPGATRPQDFSTSKGDGRTVTVWRRR
jgi:uncharacterized protein (TIGR03067 family)